MRRTAITLALLVATANRLQSQAVPATRATLPLVGNWQLNLGRTHYGSGVDRRRRERMVCTIKTDRLRCVIRSVRADGHALAGQFTAALDGTTAPVTGIPDVDEVQLRRPSASLIDAPFLWEASRRSAIAPFNRTMAAR